MDNIIACVRCHVCALPFTENCVIANLKCGHVYHQGCIDIWIDAGDMPISLCPLPSCRVPIDTKPTRLYLIFDRQPYSDLYRKHSELIAEQSGRQRLLDTLQAEKCEWGRSSATSESKILSLQLQIKEFNRKLKEFENLKSEYTELQQRLTASQSEILTLMHEQVESKRRMREKFQEKLTSEQGKRIERDLRIEYLHKRNAKNQRQIRWKKWEFGEMVKQMRARVQIDSALDEIEENMNHLEKERLCLMREKRNKMPGFCPVRSTVNQQDPPEESATTSGGNIHDSENSQSMRKRKKEDTGDRVPNADSSVMKKAKSN